MKGGSMDESMDLESLVNYHQFTGLERLVNYHQFTGLERLVKYHQLITELECEPLGNMQVLAEESELVAAAKYFNEHYILPSIAELLRPDREPDITIDIEDNDYDICSGG